jgi:chromosome segregation ATPase
LIIVHRYVAGSIVRVKLDNFVTYDHVEFRPGAQLNMIIGPNGTGKSTIVCAITLGLGWPPKAGAAPATQDGNWSSSFQILGRAPEISAFVKQGCKKAYTEIELKGRAGKSNVIIKREFNRDDKKSIWFMNGERTTGQKVSNIVSDLGIQIGNLCAFLPQDKVAEFAQMNPRELLKATMEAAGDPNLTSWHNILVNNAGKLETYLQASLVLSSQYPAS